MNEENGVVYESDGWRTPSEVFDPLMARYNFVIDLCASAQNTKCPRFFTKEQNALNQEWPRLTEGWCWLQPPYSKPNLELFTAEAKRQAKAGSGIVALIPATPGTAWFQDNIFGGCDLLSAEAVDRGRITGFELSLSGIGYRLRVLFLEGRIAFIPPPGFTGASSGPSTDSVILEYRPAR